MARRKKPQPVMHIQSVLPADLAADFAAACDAAGLSRSAAVRVLTRAVVAGVIDLEALSRGEWSVRSEKRFDIGE